MLCFISCNSHAFTLIELLVEVDLIGITPAQSPSAIITDTSTVDTSTKSITNNLSSRAQNVFRTNLSPGLAGTQNHQMNHSGFSAGDSINGFGLWVNYTYSDYENDFATIAFEGDTQTVMAGIDFSPWENTILGIAFGYEDSDIQTAFNSGEQDSKGFTVAPYFAMLFNNNWSADVSFGTTKVDNEQSLNNVIGVVPVTISSDYDSRRWFATGNINGLFTHENWVFTNQLGVLWANNTQEQYTETIIANLTRNVQGRENNLTQLLISGEAAYTFQMLEPYFRVAYVYDIDRTELSIDPALPQPSDDDDDFVLSTGIRIFSKSGLSGNLEYSKRLGRDDFDEDIASILFRMDL